MSAAPRRSRGRRIARTPSFRGVGESCADHTLRPRFIGAGLCLALLACGVDPTGQDFGRRAYDPATDPGVNPEWLFEPVPEHEPERVDTEATVVRYALDRPTTLNPLFGRTWADNYLFQLLFDPLVHRDRNLDGEWNANLVQSVEELEGGLMHRVRLNEGLTWHDGAPFTSHDVRFSYEAIADENVPAIDWKYKVMEIEDVRILDDRTFDIVHRRVSALRVDNLYFPIVPKHLLDVPEERAKDPSMRASTYYNRYMRELGIGNGAYRLVDWIVGDRVIVERWEDYPSAKPPIFRQAITSQPDRNSALLQFRAGKLDDIWLTVQQHGSQTNSDDFREVGAKVWTPRWMQGYIGWNLDGSNPFFGDVRVRRAMAHAYDRERTLSNVTWNLYLPSNGIFDSTHWAHNPDVLPIEYDLERSAELLDEAGWLLDEEDGFRYKEIDGERVRFHFTMVLPQSFVDALRMVDIFRDALRRLGITFETQVRENATHLQSLIQHEFQAHVGTYQVFAYPDIWRNHFHTDAITQGRNFHSYSSEAVDGLFDSSAMELDREKRAALLRQMQKTIFDDQAVLFLWNYSTTWGFNRRMRGVTTSPSGVLGFRPGPRGWWVERTH